MNINDLDDLDDTLESFFDPERHRWTFNPLQKIEADKLERAWKTQGPPEARYTGFRTWASEAALTSVAI
jgi:hypothetical protein